MDFIGHKNSSMSNRETSEWNHKKSNFFIEINFDVDKLFDIVKNFMRYLYVLSVWFMNQKLWIFILLLNTQFSVWRTWMNEFRREKNNKKKSLFSVAIKNWWNCTLSIKFNLVLCCSRFSQRGFFLPHTLAVNCYHSKSYATNVQKKGFRNSNGNGITETYA